MNRDRRNEIAELVNRHGTIRNEDLMERFDISIETVRRDLTYLEEQGVLERVYGGAVRKTFLNTEPVYTSRENEHADEKLAIGKLAKELIQSDDTVFFDIGTTTIALVKQMDMDMRITAFTNAIRVAVELSKKGCKVILPGGEIRPMEWSISGALTLNTLKEFNFDKAIIGAGGVTMEGITDFQPEEGVLRKEIIKNARQVIAVADFSKFGVRAMCNICNVEDIDVLVTDDKAPANILNEYRKKGVRVIVAKPDERE